MTNERSDVELVVETRARVVDRVWGLGAYVLLMAFVIAALAH